MARPCKVCEHRCAEEISVALACGSPSHGVLAKRYGLTKGTLARHKANHLAEEIIRSEVAIQRVSGPISGHPGGIAAELQAMKEKAEALGDAAEQGKDYRTALLAIREMRQLIESQERILADRRQQAADVAQSPSWKRLQARLVHALSPVPGAIEAIQTALREHVKQG